MRQRRSLHRTTTRSVEDGLASLEVVCHARFVRLYGRHGYQ